MWNTYRQTNGKVDDIWKIAGKIWLRVAQVREILNCSRIPANDDIVQFFYWHLGYFEVAGYQQDNVLLLVFRLYLPLMKDEWRNTDVVGEST